MTKQVISIKMEPNQTWTYRLDVSTAPERGHALGIRSYRMMSDYAAFLGSITLTMAMSTGQNGTDCLEGSDR